MKSAIKKSIFIVKSLYIGLFMLNFKTFFIQMGTFFTSKCSILVPLIGDFPSNIKGTKKVPFIFQNVY